MVAGEQVEPIGLTISLRGRGTESPANCLTDVTTAGIGGYRPPVTVVARRSTARRVFSVDGTSLSRNEKSLILPSAPRAKPLSAMTPLSDPGLGLDEPGRALGRRGHIAQVPCRERAGAPGDRQRVVLHAGEVGVGAVEDEESTRTRSMGARRSARERPLPSYSVELLRSIPRCFKPLRCACLGSSQVGGEAGLDRDQPVQCLGIVVVAVAQHGGDQAVSGRVGPARVPSLGPRGARRSCGP